MKALLLASVMAGIVAGAGCARFGYSSRVLHRVPSPDGRFVAVCQEVPIFDGPEFDVRLERPDGRLVRALFHMGDGGGCSELAWSHDGRSLAVLTAHVAGITVVDVSWALANPAERNRHWFVRGFSFSSEGTFVQAASLRFLSTSELAFQTCQYSRGDAAQPRQDQLQPAAAPSPPPDSRSSDRRPSGLNTTPGRSSNA